MQFSSVLAASALAATAAAQFSNSTIIELTNTTITTDVTVTGFTTYCPMPTQFVVVTCNESKCQPKTISVSAPTTVTIDSAVVATTFTATGTTTETRTCTECKAAPTGNGTVASFHGAGARNAVGALAGFAAIAAALI
ncbi:uncharacterized protein RJT20DRAFT_4082 [Scheffersomyces xylosifermentans]|uniref:uncharacterized protein n=1 Tax=Scheffersomyces xylosifermentans TaxID=1304137 RepID=UPI00315C71C8